MRLAYWIVSSSRFPGALGRSLSLVVLGIAARIVPEELRSQWREEWQGDFWHWMLKAAEANDPDARRALLDHTVIRRPRRLGRAFRNRFRQRAGIESSWAIPNCRFSPEFAAIALIAIASGGFSATRHLAARLPYRDPGRLVVLAQGPPVFGMRLGFRQVETDLFRRKSQTLSGIAAYSWHNGITYSARANSAIRLANVDPSFFEVLGVAAPTNRLAEDQFFVSRDYWQGALRADPSLGGRTYHRRWPSHAPGRSPARKVRFSFRAHRDLDVASGARASASSAPFVVREFARHRRAAGAGRHAIHCRQGTARSASAFQPGASQLYRAGDADRVSDYRNLQSYTWDLLSLLIALLVWPRRARCSIRAADFPAPIRPLLGIFRP